MSMCIKALDIISYFRKHLVHVQLCVCVCVSIYLAVLFTGKDRVASLSSLNSIEVLTEKWTLFR